MERHGYEQHVRPGLRRGVFLSLATLCLIALVGLGWSSPGTNAAPDAPGDALPAERTTYVLVRHAEKADDGTRDPPLTAEGTARAGRLAGMIASMDVAAVVTTPYERTRKTGAPTANRFGLDARTYDPKNPGDVLGALAHDHAGRVIVVVGHSNTVPGLVRSLGADPGVAEIDEGEYDRLYIVTTIEGQPPVCHLVRY